MSIFFDFDVGPTGRRLRRAVEDDKHDIERIIQREYTEPLFGAANIGALIELSTLAICMINEKKEVTGFMALGDHPVQVVIDAANWEIWIRNMFKCFYLSRNTLFIHFMCCSDDVLDVFMCEAIAAVFTNDVYLANILLLVPKGCPEECYLKYNVFNFNPTCKRTAMRIGGDNMGMFMFLAQSQDFCPKLKLRRAVEEDNSDVVEILDKKCKRLKDLYGEYYVAELVGHHPETTRRIIVGELQDRSIAGMMCLNSEINYELLQKTYNLRPFYGLTKATPIEKEKQRRSNKLLTTFGEPLMVGQWSPFSRRVKIETHSEQAPTKAPPEPRKRKISRVNFGHTAHLQSNRMSYAGTHFEKEVERNRLQARGLSPTVSQTTYMSVSELLDEDPFDYDILNIDEGLVLMPDAIPASEMNAELEQAENETEIKMFSYTFENQGTEKNTKAPRSPPFKPINVKPDKNAIKYLGQPNAFLIELFALRDDVHERHAFDLLEAAFEMMKDYDYCIIKIPLEETAFSLLQHFCYVPTIGDICTNFALYVANRSAIFGKLRVRDAEIADIPQIAMLMDDMEGNDTIWTVENTLMKEHRNRVYVLICGQRVVGFGILEPPEEIDFIRTRFLLESYYIHKYHQQQGDYGCGFTTLKTVMVYRVFEPHLRFFARDIMRLSGSNSLLWLTAYRNKLVAHKANSLASVMIPLMPRKITINYVETLELKRIALLSKNVKAIGKERDNKPKAGNVALPNTVNPVRTLNNRCHRMPFATWFLSKKYCSVPMTDINTRIVIVGASRTTMAFINTLLFSDSCSYLFFNNVTLISPTGLPYVRNKKYTSSFMFKFFNTSSDKFIKSVPYTYYLNVVQATMVDINKKLKYVTVSTGGKIYYDILLLTFGKQYQPPDYFERILQKEQQQFHGRTCQYTRLDIPKIPPEPRITMEHLPHNAFVINNFEDSARAISYVTKISSWDYTVFDYKIVVYGASVHAYCCITALLDMNVPPENIIFVEPFPPEDETKTRVPFFCNYYVDQTIQEVLKNLRITVYRSYYFLNWTVGADHYVTQVDFLSHLKKISLQCYAFFYYGKKGINHHAFLAINKSGIAYNDGILIDHNFRTKNPSVYAAGPATRYYGKYLADHKHHKYYDAYEIGEKLAEILTDKLDPLFKAKQEKESDSVNGKSSVSSSTDGDQNKGCIADIPELKGPLVTYCTLPGGLQYLEVRPPGTRNPHHYVQSLHHNGHVLETFNQGYFKLHLDMNQVVDGITCLSPVTFSLERFKNLYGKPTNVLNNVYVKFITNRIDDFFEYFREPWAQFLYLDHVDELFSMIKELHPKLENKKRKPPKIPQLAKIEESTGITSSLMGPKPSKGPKPPKLTEPRLLSAKSCVDLRPNFEQSLHMDIIIKYLLDWIEQHDILLPMYMHPAKNRYFVYDLKVNPAFRKKKKSVAKLLRNVMNRYIK